MVNVCSYTLTRQIFVDYDLLRHSTVKQVGLVV